MVRKLHIREDYESDMIAYNQAMDVYKQDMKNYKQRTSDVNYKQQVKDAKKLDKEWKIKLNKFLSNCIENQCEPDIMKLLNTISRRYDTVIKFIYCDYLRIDVEDISEDGESVSVWFYLLVEPVIENSSMLTDLENGFSNILKNQFDITNIKKISSEPYGERTEITVRTTLSVVNSIGKLPSKSIKIPKPIEPVAPKNPNADYEVKRKAYYDPADDIEELFYGLADNTMPNIEQALKQAKWLLPSGIYIPKGTQFNLGPNKWVGDYLYKSIQIVRGPMDGLLVPFLEGDDDLCRNTFIRNYCKKI